MMNVKEIFGGMENTKPISIRTHNIFQILYGLFHMICKTILMIHFVNKSFAVFWSAGFQNNDTSREYYSLGHAQHSLPYVIWGSI